MFSNRKLTLKKSQVLKTQLLKFDAPFLFNIRLIVIISIIKTSKLIYLKHGSANFGPHILFQNIF